MSVKVDLEARTVQNVSDADIVLKELIIKVTTLAPDQTVMLDPNTKVIET